MSEITEIKAIEKAQNRRVHMANERTFLAWIRTSIGVMAFGFVVEKFALFMKQMTYVLGKTTLGDVLPLSHGYSAIIGIFLVGLGALMGLLAFLRFKKVEKQINDDSWKQSSILDAILAISVLAVGVFLVIYLIYSI